MKNEFVTYEQALALRELGFDEPCLAFYSPKEELYPVFQEPSKGPYFNNGSFIETLRAPLYQQAFKWFRELGFDSSIYRARTKTKIYCWSISNISSGLEYPPSMIGEKADTYEEAESACLDKLIEITNEKIKNR